MKKKKITLLYRSGAKVHIKADSFEISRQAGTDGATEVRCTGADPAIGKIGMQELVAVFEGWV